MTGPRSPWPRTAVVALTLAIVAATIVGGALFIEHALGVKPCELCLQERIPYYVGAPLALLAALVLRRRPSGAAATLLFLLLAIVFAVGTGMGVYHAGVEFKWWPGPSDCTGPIGQAVQLDDFLKQLESTKVVRCDEVAMRILGLSLAAWNALVMAGLTALSLAGAVLARRGP